MSFAEHQTKDRRLAILLLLEGSGDYTANEYLLMEALNEVYGHVVGRDRLVGDLDWLAEQELLTVREPGGTRLVTLTSRGADVCAGRTRVTGVKRPQPRSAG